MVNLFRFIPGYEDTVYESGREPALVMLLSFLIAFALTRGYTRVARARGWGSANVGGVHMHHVVVGMLMAIGAAALEFAFETRSFWELLLASVFGVGAALVLDEFALVFHLEDVYWSDEGRSSVDAVVISTALGIVLLLHTTPLDANVQASHWVLMAIIAANVVFVLITAVKGKLVTAALGVFVPGLPLIGAIRLAKPRSAWARWFYKPSSSRLRRAERRFGPDSRREVRKTRLLDLIGGAPTAPTGGGAVPQRIEGDNDAGRV